MDRAMATEYRRVLMGLVSTVCDWYGRDGHPLLSVCDSKVVYRPRHDELSGPRAGGRGDDAVQGQGS